jgi:predicted dehydrogenase
MQPVTLLIIGAGSRGKVYANYALKHPEQAQVIGIADPREFYRGRLSTAHTVPTENVVESWQQLAERPKFADAVVIAVPDAQHREPAIAFAAKGYHILLEKPLAPDPESCQQIVDAAAASKAIFAVCHVMRYTDYSQRLKALTSSGLIGDIVSIQHLEPVGFWHYAHSFVRGNWRNEALSSPMLLAKSCHDIDWLRYIIGRPCVEVSSHGSLLHFRKDAKPVEAGEARRCLDCTYEPSCSYSAKRFYHKRRLEGATGWPLDVITTDISEAGVNEALRTGPYGRCVYECDNDVVDHQVVNLLYEGGATASFTMIATSETRDRETIIFGTKGELRGSGEKIVHYDFLTEQTTQFEIEQVEGGHGGGDYRIMQAFTAAVGNDDSSGILSGPLESLETHMTVFAAEQARRTHSVVRVRPVVEKMQ